MQLSIIKINGRFQRNVQNISRFTLPDLPQFIYLKIKSLMRNPLTFVILVWGIMFLFASVYFVCAQEATGLTLNKSANVRSPRANAESKADAGKRKASSVKVKREEAVNRR